MTGYWSQWTHTELMSMQGLEPCLKECLYDVEYDEVEIEDEDENEESCTCGIGCFACLGLSWTDFF